MEKCHRRLSEHIKKIEAKATKVGRLVEAKNLLAELKKAHEIHGRFQRNVRELTIDQRKLLPILK